MFDASHFMYLNKLRFYSLVKKKLNFVQSCANSGDLNVYINNFFHALQIAHVHDSNLILKEKNSLLLTYIFQGLHLPITNSFTCEMSETSEHSN